MARIKVQKKSDHKGVFTFNVEVIDDDGKTAHTVELDKSHYERLTGRKVQPAELVEKSFSFLLGREPKESILRRFNLEEISHYFPKYEEEIKKILQESD